MKISVSSYSFSAYVQKTGASCLDLCNMAKKLGFDGIEFTDLPGDNPLALAKEIADHCRKIGLETVAYAVSANMLAEDIDKEVTRLCTCVDIAKTLGVSVMRHDAAFQLKDKPGYTWQDGIRDMAEPIRRVSSYAEKQGIKTCTENHGYIYQEATRVKQLMDAVNHSNYGWLVDIGNFLCADDSPLTAVTLGAPYAFHVHAKDFLYKKKQDITVKPDGFFSTSNGNYLRGTVVGHGVVPVYEAIQILKKAGYDGWITLEFEGMEDNISALETGLKYLRACITDN